MSEMRFTRSDVGARPWRRGFTFTEVLFAVMLLGIGFVMVAAIFPVAIQQSQANREDTAGIIVAKAGAKMMQTIQFTRDELKHGHNDYDLATVLPFDNQKIPPTYQTRYSRLRANLISKADPRYAWVPLGYKLGTPTGLNNFPYYEVYIVAVACRNKSAYDEQVDAIDGWTFEPKEINFKLEDGGSGSPDLIYFSNPANDSSYVAFDEPAAAEGTFILVADDQVPTNHPLCHEANGRFYRLGVKRDDLGVGVWELAPGYDMANDLEDLPRPDASKKKPAIGYMVGRGYSNPLDKDSGFEGPAQDLFAMPTTVYFPF